LIAHQQRLTFWREVRYSIGLLMYVVGTAVSLFDARIALLIYAGMAFYYVIEPLMAARQVGRLRPVPASGRACTSMCRSLTAAAPG